MPVHCIFPKKKICIFCGKKVDGYFKLTWDYKDYRNDSKQGIDFIVYSNPYHIKCAAKLLELDDHET